MPSATLHPTPATPRTARQSAAALLPGAVLCLTLGLAVNLPATAQQKATEATTATAEHDAENRTKPALEAKVERIQHEDSGSRIDELRIEGQTRNVQVQPKTIPLAPYHVDTRPENGSLIHQDSNPTGKTNRSWKLLRF